MDLVSIVLYRAGEILLASQPSNVNVKTNDIDTLK